MRISKERLRQIRWEAFIAGFNSSGDEWNGSYSTSPMDHDDNFLAWIEEELGE